MKRARRQKKETQTQDKAPAQKKSFFKSEWPLFLYPALVVTALIVLYGVNRSMQNRPGPSDRPEVQTTDTSQTTADAKEKPRPKPEFKPEPKTKVPSNRPAPRREPNRDRPAPKPAPTPSESEETTTVLATLGQALESDDHATIKQCIKELVALGDGAVEGLGEMVMEGDEETAQWAAEALARIGTPYATSMLLTAMEDIGNTPLREQLVRQVSGITNHESWPVLMDAMLQNRDAGIQRATAASLARMADTAIVDEIVTLYEAATTEAEKTQLARLVSNISSTEASESLLALAGDPSATPQNNLEEAAIKALANVGDAQSVSFLLQRLEASGPSERSSVYMAITGINQPQAQSALLYAAAGNKEVSQQGQAAAIYALGNFPNTQTYTLLQQIAATQDDATVLSAAVRTLERIERSTPALRDTVTSKANP